jgi:hypothetical protein
MDGGEYKESVLNATEMYTCTWLGGSVYVMCVLPQLKINK